MCVLLQLCVYYLFIVFTCKDLSVFQNVCKCVCAYFAVNITTTTTMNFDVFISVYGVL